MNWIVLHILPFVKGKSNQATILLDAEITPVLISLLQQIAEGKAVHVFIYHTVQALPERKC